MYPILCIGTYNDKVKYESTCCLLIVKFNIFNSLVWFVNMQVGQALVARVLILTHTLSQKGDATKKRKLRLISKYFEVTESLTNYIN